MLIDQITTGKDADSRWKLIYTKKLERDIIDSFALFRENGMEPILIKGWVSARNFPPGHFRFYQDVDLCVPEKDYAAAKALKGSDRGKHLMIDLHREVRHLDSRPWQNLFDDSQLAELDGVQIRIPSDEDHLRILAAHWLNDGGEQKERLWDVYYAIENRSDGFDWNKCLATVRFNRRGWVVAAASAAKKYLGLKVDDLPFAAETDQLPDWFTHTLEKNWADGHKSNMLAVVMDNKREFFKQVRKKIPPNPIQATVENDGDLYSRKIPLYQLSSLARRAGPSIRSIVRKAVHRESDV